MMINPTEKEPGWLLPAERQQRMGAGLYLVSTPIGNLADITLRALDVLSACDLVACEDTRVSGKLLNYYGIKKPLLSYNDHNADKQRGFLLEKLQGGQKIALISDAGTPLISDPGFKLVRDCAEAGIYVTSLPGPNAILPALQLSGMGSESFYFGGFLPAKSEARKKTLKECEDIPSTLIFFETAPRLVKTLADIEIIMGKRAVAILRELTKLYEEARKGTARQLMEQYQSKGLPKGEIVLIIEKPESRLVDNLTIERALHKALKTMPTKDAVRSVAEMSGRSKKELYALALKLNEKA